MEQLDQTSKFLSERHELNIEQSADKLKQLNASNLAVNLNQAVNQYKQLKRLYLGLQSKLLFSDALSDPDSLDEEHINSDLRESVTKGRDAKNAVEEGKAQIEALSEQIQEMLEVYHEKYETLKTLYSTVNEKKKKLDDKVGGGKSDPDENQLLLNVISAEIETMEAQQKTWFSDIHGLKTSNRKLRAEVDEATQEVKTLNEQGTRLNEQLRFRGHDSVSSDDLEQLERLSGVKVKSFQHNTMVITLTDTEPSESELSTDMTITFNVDDDGLHTLHTAHLSNEDIDITDLVFEARSHNSLSTLVTLVRDRWAKSYRLMAEINTLRDRYALDWRVSESVVQVLYSNVACTLRVGAGYPGPGSVTLLSVSGRNVRDIQPGPGVVTLTQWLEFLSSHLQQ